MAHKEVPATVLLSFSFYTIDSTARNASFIDSNPLGCSSTMSEEDIEFREMCLSAVHICSFPIEKILTP